MRIMATVNIIKSSFNGKLGELYGTKQFGNAYLKAIPFSHAPHSEAQTQSVRAFEKLNRFASGLARSVFYTFGVKDNKKLKHNIVASILKPIIKDKTFDIKNLAELMPEDGTTEILEFTVDQTLNTIRARARTNQPVNKNKKEYWIIAIFDETGDVIYSASPDVDYFDETIETPVLGNHFAIVAWRSDKRANKQWLHGVSFFDTLPIVENHIIYTGRANWHVQPYVLNHTLYISSQDAEKILHLLKFNITRRN